MVFYLIMNADKQLEIIRQGTVQVISEAELKEKLQQAAKEKRPLRVKYGADPSAPDIHLGHTVPLRKLRQFQDMGHEVIFIIGDFTAMIGDPSGRSETRPALSLQQVEENAKTYKRQVFKILDPKKTKVVYNSHWLNKLKLTVIVSLTAKYTVARMLERDVFVKRYKGGQPISMVEFLYPLLQGYDSVELKADVELGGTDQTFNLLVSREIQREYGQEAQVVITMPILEGTDGVNKMSKSLGNYIAVEEPPKDMYGKIMSVSDQLMLRYYNLLTEIDSEKLARDIKEGRKHPMEAKKELARTIVSQYYGNAKAGQAEAEFQKVFSQRETPSEMPSVAVGKGEVWIVQLVVDTGAVKSKGEARRLIRQGGITIDGEKITDEEAKLKPPAGAVIKVGKRHFFKVTPK